jgi:hypothetical protein
MLPYTHTAYLATFRRGEADVAVILEYEVAPLG